MIASPRRGPHMASTRLWIVALVCALSGCGKSGPSCSDEWTLNTLKTIYVEQVGNALRAFGKQHFAQQFASSANFSVVAISTQGQDEASGLRSCAATIQIAMSAKTAAELDRSRGAFLLHGIRDRWPHIVFRDDHAESTITYTAQLTDDHKQLRMHVEGIEPLARLTAVLGNEGEFISTVSADAKTGVSSTSTTMSNPVIPAEDSGSTKADTYEASAPSTEERQRAEERPWHASFDCARASTDAERLVCSSEELSNADVKLASAYKQAHAIATDKDGLKRDQMRWRKFERDVCRDAACVLDAYRRRTASLEALAPAK